jgi:phage/plasmid-associated DNA primase
VEEYKREMSSLETFFDARCEFGPDYTAPTTALRDAYESWCQQKRREVQSDKAMAKALKEHSCEAYRTADTRGWKGIRLTAPGGTFGL